MASVETRSGAEPRRSAESVGRVVFTGRPLGSRAGSLMRLEGLHGDMDPCGLRTDAKWYWKFG